jgi:hypothetical protein
MSKLRIPIRNVGIMHNWNGSQLPFLILSCLLTKWFLIQVIGITIISIHCRSQHTLRLPPLVSLVFFARVVNFLLWLAYPTVIVIVSWINPLSTKVIKGIMIGLVWLIRFLFVMVWLQDIIFVLDFRAHCHRGVLLRRDLSWWCNMVIIWG